MDFKQIFGEEIGSLAEFVMLPTTIGMQENFYVRACKGQQGKVQVQEIKIVEGKKEALEISIYTYPTKIRFEAKIPTEERQIIKESEIYDKKDTRPYQRAVELMRPYLKKGE